MLHSKAYLLEMADNSAVAFVGSHNLTGFALLGLNGEAGVLLEGDAMEAPFVDLRQHVAASVAQWAPYDPSRRRPMSGGRPSSWRNSGPRLMR